MVVLFYSIIVLVMIVWMYWSVVSDNMVVQYNSIMVVLVII